MKLKSLNRKIATKSWVAVGIMLCVLPALAADEDAASPAVEEG